MSKTHNATGGNADAPSTASTMAVMGQQLTDENAQLRALLAQREAELEALREKVAKVSAMHEPRPKSSRDMGRLPQGCSCGAHYWPCPTVAALSDNQEGQWMTDEERCEDCNVAYGHDGLVWRATDDLWAMIGWGERGLLCPNCFVKRLKAQGVTPYFAAVREDVWLSLMMPVGHEGRCSCGGHGLNHFKSDIHEPVDQEGRE